MKEAAASATASAADIAATLDPASLQTLTEAMGFSLLRAQKGLLYGTGGTVEGAVEWLTLHQDDADIDTAPITSDSIRAQSYKCNDCGKILSNMANLELHANKTGHSDFEESTERVKPLTEEEKQAKIAEIKVRERLCVFCGVVFGMDVRDTVSHLIARLSSFLPNQFAATPESQTRRTGRSRKGRRHGTGKAAPVHGQGDGQDEGAARH